MMSAMLKAATRFLASVGACLVSSQTIAQIHCGTYPNSVYEMQSSGGWSDCDLRDIGEKPLWKGLPTGTAQILRFTFTEGHASFFRVVTIARKSDGSVILRVAGGGHRNSNRETSFTRSFKRRLSAEEINRVEVLVSETDTFKFENGSWDGDEIFMHCQFLEMESAGANGYRYSNVNIGCSHPTKLMPLINEVVRLAKLKTEADGRLYY